MIIFDFDGVLVDSINEIALSSYNLVTGSRVIHPDLLPEEYKRSFIANRHLTLGPPRAVALARWIIKSLEDGDDAGRVLDRGIFITQVLEKKDESSLSDYYAIRQWLIEEHKDNWLEINKPFKAIWAACQRLDPNSYFILTNKNKKAVLAICKHYGLRLNESHLFTGEEGRTKRENIVELDKIGNSDTDYIYIDDAIENLESLSKALPGRIQMVMATWGYGSEQDFITARNHGFELVSELDFIRRHLSE